MIVCRNEYLPYVDTIIVCYNRELALSEFDISGIHYTRNKITTHLLYTCTLSQADGLETFYNVPIMQTLKRCFYFQTKQH